MRLRNLYWIPFTFSRFLNQHSRAGGTNDLQLFPADGSRSSVIRGDNDGGILVNSLFLHLSDIRFDNIEITPHGIDHIRILGSLAVLVDVVPIVRTVEMIEAKGIRILFTDRQPTSPELFKKQRIVFRDKRFRQVRHRAVHHTDAVLEAGLYCIGQFPVQRDLQHLLE